MTVFSANHCQVLGSQRTKDALSLESSQSKEEIKEKQMMEGKCSKETQNAKFKLSLEPDSSREVISEDIFEPRQSWACQKENLCQKIRFKENNISKQGCTLMECDIPENHKIHN